MLCLETIDVVWTAPTVVGTGPTTAITEREYGG